MLNLRVTGAMLLGISGTLGAYMLNRRLGVTLDWLEAWISLIRFARMQVSCFSLPFKEILLRADPAILHRCGWRGGQLGQSMAEFYSFCERRDGESDAVLREFARGFGGGYREEQLRQCDYYLECLQQRRDVLAQELPRKRKLNTTLCICGTLGALILLW